MEDDRKQRCERKADLLPVGLRSEASELWLAYISEMAATLY
jgi:hypothetical protein